MVGSDAHGPDDAVFVVMLFHDGLHGAAYADAIASHLDQLVLLVLVLVGEAQSLGIFVEELKDLAHLDGAGGADGLTADRAGIAFLQQLDVLYDVGLVVSAVVDVDIVMIFLAGARAHVLGVHQLAVHDDGAVVQTDGSGKAADAAGDRAHRCFVRHRKGEFGDVQSVDQLDLVHLAVAADEGCHVADGIVVGHLYLVQQRLDALVLGQTEEIADVLDGLGARSELLFQGLFVLLGHYGIAEIRLLIGGCHIAVVAVEDGLLAHFAQRAELVRTGAADGAGVRFYRSVVEPAAVEHVAVRLIVQLVRVVEAFDVAVEAVVILHDELAAADEPETGTRFVSVFVLDLIQLHRKLTVGRDVLAGDVRKDFLVGGSQTELSAVAVLDAPQLGSVGRPAAGFLPQFGGFQNAGLDLLGADGVHLFAHDVLDLAQRAGAEGQISVNACHLLADESGAQQQDVAGDLRFRGNFPQRIQIHVRCSHKGVFPFYLTVAVARHAMALPSPVKPRPSSVVALMDTAETGTPNAFAVFSIMVCA